MNIKCITSVGKPMSIHFLFLGQYERMKNS